MENVLTYEQYSQLHDIVTQQEFSNCEKRAQFAIIRATGFSNFNKAVAQLADNPPWKEQFLECIAKMIDYQNGEAIKNIKNRMGIKAVRNDNYSEEYVVNSVIDFSQEEKHLVNIWLSGTGILRAY